MAIHIRRRAFISALLGGAAVAWPLAARAQRAKVPIVGFFTTGANDPGRWGAALQGLKEAGYLEGQNVVIEYRAGPLSIDRLRELAADLIRRQVAVILAANDGPALAAKRETSTVPIVFFAVGF